MIRRCFNELGTAVIIARSLPQRTEKLRSPPYMIRCFLALLVLISASAIAKDDNATIAIFVSGNAVNGINPKIEVWIDGIQYKWSFGGDTVVTANNSTGAVQEV